MTNFRSCDSLDGLVTTTTTLLSIEIYHIVSQSSTANDTPIAPELGERKTIKPSEGDEKQQGKRKCPGCAGSQ